MVCINSCIEVDLLGQIAAETVNGYQFSGSGGQLNFVNGANIAEDGKGKVIFAFHSTFTDSCGQLQSKITPFLKPYSVVTTPRNCVDYIVTEYGIASLKWKDDRERAKSLIEIAHPQFRNWLKEEYKKHFGLDL